MHLTHWNTPVCAYHMLQVGGREEIAIFVLSMWFHAVGRE